MTQNPFQPWKQNFNLTNQFHRKTDTDLSSAFNKVKNGDAGLAAMTHPYDMSSDLQSYPGPCTSSNTAPNIEGESSAGKASNHTAAKFSIFSQLLNLNKINAFDNLLLNASMILDDDDLKNDRRQGIKKIMEQAISDTAKHDVNIILEKISVLRPAEKLFLYLKMPGGLSVDPLKQSQNPLGTRSEISHTINWVKSHLEHDEKVSIPKQEVYEDYVNFCGKINIKALSTADFGKVMKQVFPDIRPRRLGTRGHSRYCYAAFRKASQLPDPELPDFLTKNELGSDTDDTTWNVIKSWSEGLLNTQFDSVDKLATYITQNHLKPTSTSKLLLQKKIMQREVRDRRSNNNPSTQKRRKKKRESVEMQDHEQEDIFHEDIQIKQEKEENNFSEDSSDLPMNLTSTEQSRRLYEKPPGTNQTVANNDQISDRNQSEVRSNLNISEAFDSNDLNQEDDNQYVFCKKVRQAQQLKMTANASHSISNPVRNSETPHEMLMPSKIPSKRKQKRESNAPDKKIRCLERSGNGSQSESPLNHVESNDFIVKNGDLKEEFILPRERFISICNMDKNALDEYMNGENSQDMELLQYFDEDRNKRADCIEEDLGPASTSIPVLENYQLFNEARNIDKASDKILQLRSMLEEKHNLASSASSGGESVIKNLLQKTFQHASTEISGCDQDDVNGSHPSSYTNIEPRPHYNSVQHVRAFQIGQTVTNGADKQISQSPNTRRKNFSFVPIPAQSTRAKNINLHPVFKSDSSQFVSPRATPTNQRAPISYLRNSNVLVDPSSSVPVIGVNSNTAFSRPNLFKMEPCEDRHPQSPSIAQNYNYSPQMHQNPNQFQFQPLNNQQGTIYNYPVESRSQSVPPHSSNTNMYNNYNNSYSSACSSMAATPVPSDYQEFSETSILDIFNNEQVESTPSVKIEHLLDHEILNHNSAENQTNRQTFVNSRSVPNTPLPYQRNYNSSYCPNGKSVPTTPIGTNVAFRYSPELQRTRDFLINGFSNNNNSVICPNTQKVLGESFPNDMDDLSNLDL